MQIPSYGGKQQLSLHKVEVSEKVSEVCIHVKRVIGLLKQIQNSARNSPTKNKHGSQDCANIDRILTVCAALVLQLFPCKIDFAY